MVPATAVLMIVVPAKSDEKENTTMAEGRKVLSPLDGIDQPPQQEQEKEVIELNAA